MSDNKTKKNRTADDIKRDAERDEITYEALLMKIIVDGTKKLYEYRPVKRGDKLVFQKKGEKDDSVNITKLTKIEVTSCNDCFFFEFLRGSTDVFGTCKHPAGASEYSPLPFNVYSYWNADIYIPEECPLLKSKNNCYIEIKTKQPKGEKDDRNDGNN
jgi:hypothetical protein